MIRVNLLPESYRKVEHTPRPRLYTIMLSVIVNTLLLLYFGYLYMQVVPDLREQKTQAEEQLASTTERSKEYDTLKTESDAIEMHKKTVADLESAHLELTPKIDQFLSLLPDEIWVTKVQFLPEQAPKSSKDDPIPAGLAFDCQTVHDPYAAISQFRKNLQGQTAAVSDADKKQKIEEFARDVKMPLPPISGYNRVKIGGASVDGYEWTQTVLFKILGKYDVKKK